MAKDFLNWFKVKSKIQANKDRPYFREREIWSTTLGLNIGDEQDGRDQSYLRPILVVRKFNNHLFWGIPLTKKLKIGIHYYQFNLKKDIISIAILSQLRLLDSKRLQYKIGIISPLDFRIIKEKLRIFLS